MVYLNLMFTVLNIDLIVSFIFFFFTLRIKKRSCQGYCCLWEKRPPLSTNNKIFKFIVYTTKICLSVYSFRFSFIFLKTKKKVYLFLHFILLRPFFVVVIFFLLFLYLFVQNAYL